MCYCDRITLEAIKTEVIARDSKSFRIGSMLYSKGYCRCTICDRVETIYENPCNECGTQYAACIGIKDDEEPRKLCLGSSCIEKYLYVKNVYGIEKATDLYQDAANLLFWF